MSGQKVELLENVEKQNSSETLAVEDDIIDVSAFDFSDTDRWLYEPVRYSSETTVHDLYAWLRNSSDAGFQNSRIATKKSIDTRTFTRPKKRNSRITFESIVEASLPQLQNACNLEDKESHNFYQSANKKQTNEKKEPVPFMLKTTTTIGVNKLVPDNSLIVSGQESMEAFLNMSQSKGIDSFINLVEPDLCETLMNVSHPSMLYSSITSLTNDDTLHGRDYECIINSESVSHPMMSKRQFVKTMNSKLGLAEASSLELNDDTICIDTYNTSIPNNIPSTSANAEIEQTSPQILSSTFTNSCDLNITVVKSENNEMKNLLDTTYQCTNARKEKKQTMIKTTFDSYKQRVDDDLNVENNKTQCREIKVLPMQNDRVNQPSQVSVSGSKQPSRHENLLNSTFKSINKNTNLCQSTNLTYLPPENIPSLRRELLTEIHKSGKYKLHSVYSDASDEPCARLKTDENIDVTYDANLLHKSNIPVENKYNTCRKQFSEDLYTTENDSSGCNIVACKQKDFQNRKFYTFTKKAGNISGKNSLESVEQLNNIDTTFCKPAPKSPKKKVHVSKTLSKLPQFLQKSNPNLLSNTTKAIDITGYSHIPNVGQVKGSCISALQNITKPIGNKSYSLGKLRSGSEQRLPHLVITTIFQKPNSEGSTESIDSTQSAHSAPDLDDRLSVCSDSSHNSYNVRTMDVERLHQIAHMQEESSKQESTPKPKKQILHNNWFDELKDLPSPISKNNTEEPGSNLCSPVRIDSTVKTSSPIISPTGSSQTINSQAINEEHKIPSNLEEKEQGSAVGLAKTATSKSANTTENKTRLRQPINWNTGNKPSGIVSGIPRPSSRIPAFRCVRPNMKANQGDTKKGYFSSKTQFK